MTDNGIIDYYVRELEQRRVPPAVQAGTARLDGWREALLPTQEAHDRLARSPRLQRAMRSLKKRSGFSDADRRLLANALGLGVLR